MSLNAGTKVSANMNTIDQLQIERDRCRGHLTQRLNLLEASTDFIKFLPTVSMATYIKMIDEITENIELWGGQDNLAVLGAKISDEILRELINLSVDELDHLTDRQQRKYKLLIFPLKDCTDVSPVFEKGKPHQLTEAIMFLGMSSVSVTKAPTFIKDAIIKQMELCKESQGMNPAESKAILIQYSQETNRLVNHLYQLAASLKTLGLSETSVTEVKTEDAIKYIAQAGEIKKAEKIAALQDPSVINAKKLSTDYKIDLSRNSLVEIKRLNAQKSTAAAVKEKKHSRYVDYTPKEISLVKIRPRHNESMVCPNPFKKSYVTEELALAFIQETHTDDKRIHPYKCVCGATHIGH